MPIGGSTKVGTGLFSHPKLVSSLIAGKWFPSACTLQQATEGRDAAGSVTYQWNDVTGYITIPCRKFDRLPREERTLEIIEEVKFWTIMLGGYYPNVHPSWRAVIVETGEIFNVIGVDSDSLHLLTVLTCRAFFPTAEPGV